MLYRTKRKKKKNDDDYYYYYFAPILNILVPQTEQMPWVAGLPFFIVTFFSSFIILFALHLTQYASVAMVPVCRWG